MSKLISDAAAAMAKAGHAKRTPEQRSQKAAKAASARWKGNGLTSDQRRILRKLVTAETGSISTPMGKSGERVARAVRSLEAARVIRGVTWSPLSVGYRRGPQWRADLLG